MAVATEVVLPAQPTTGRTVYTPLGGNGLTAPGGCYMVNAAIAGDASGGVATVGITGDPRYTNLFAWANLKTAASASANDFVCILEETSGSSVPNSLICGTMPQVAAASFGTNASFLWYPPPVYFKGAGRCGGQQPNVGAGETYFLTVQIYIFAIDVLQRTPLPFLQWNVPGVSAPAAV